MLIAFLMACSGGSEPAQPTPAPEPIAAPIPVDAPVEPAEPAPAATADITFEYSSLDLDACERLDSGEEWVQWKCVGHSGVDVYVSAGDLRYDVDFGAPNDQWESLTGFNEPGSTIEWRMAGGPPYAAILRFEEEGPDGSKKSLLGVFKVGTASAPGCHLAWVPSDAEPSQNEAARAIADSKGRDSHCPAP